jgi:hypothetical protein
MDGAATAKSKKPKLVTKVLSFRAINPPRQTASLLQPPRAKHVPRLGVRLLAPVMKQR